MAYVSQQRKAELAPGIKAVLAKYGMKGSIAVRHHSTLVVTVTSGPLDILGNYNAAMAAKSVGLDPQPWVAKDYLDVNHYHYAEAFTGEALAFIDEMVTAMNVGNHDRSDIQSDYFDVGWYVDLDIGRSTAKPYVILAPAQAAA